MNWNGLVKILEIKHLNKSGDTIWSDNNLKNIFHTEGEAFMLGAVFTGNDIPDNFYFGLDTRSSLAATDTIADITNEPSSSTGYIRRPIASTGQFTLTTISGVTQTNSPVLTFSAGASGYPLAVKNLFLTTASDDSGQLISSVPFTSPISVSSNESISMRIGLSLRDCPS